MTLTDVGVTMGGEALGVDQDSALDMLSSRCQFDIHVKKLNKQLGESGGQGRGLAANRNMNVIGM